METMYQDKGREGKDFEVFPFHCYWYVHTCGGDDCALFAIAFAEALCAGRDPFILSFDQLQMRQHLKLCLEHGVVTKFPESTRQKEDVAHE